MLKKKGARDIYIYMCFAHRLTQRNRHGLNSEILINHCKERKRETYDTLNDNNGREKESFERENIWKRRLEREEKTDAK